MTSPIVLIYSTFVLVTSIESGGMFNAAHESVHSSVPGFEEGDFRL
jgi:hypothetical protein